VQRRLEELWTGAAPSVRWCHAWLSGDGSPRGYEVGVSACAPLGAPDIVPHVLPPLLGQDFSGVMSGACARAPVSLMPGSLRVSSAPEGFPELFIECTVDPEDVASCM